MQCLLSPSHRKKAGSYHFLLIFSFVMAFCLGIEFDGVVFSRPAQAYAVTQTAACSSTPLAKPGSDSLLIVLLDRSGSLGIGGSGTDPQNYSASVTGALSDLWPGPMAIIAFPSNSSGGGDTQLFGPLSPSARGQNFKNQINSLPSNGFTPLESAMNAAQSLLQQQHFPAGSRIVLITDGQPNIQGDPDGHIQEHDILTTVAPKFCQEHVTVSPFGLTIGENSNPAQFLKQVAAETGGSYERVADSSGLAGAVIGLFAAWDGLEFNLIPKDQAHGNYPIVTDSSVQSAYILTFYQNGQNESLTTAAGQKPTYQSSTDGRHYEIDTLSSPIPPATYTVRTSDPNAIVYDLVQTTRSLQLVQPIASTIAYTGRTVAIEAHLVDQGQGPVIPSKDALTFFQATVTETVHGKVLPLVTVDLTAPSGSGNFTGQFAVPQDAKPGKVPVAIGTLQIKVTANYQGVIHTTSPLTIQVVIPKYVPPPVPPPPPCRAGFWNCASQSVHVAIIGAAIFLLLLLLVLFLLWLWYRQPVPGGTLHNIPKPPRGRTRPDPDDYITVPLGTKRTWQNRIFHRSVITGDELKKHPDARGELDLELARFELVAKRGKLDDGAGKPGKNGHIVYIRPQQGNMADIAVQKGKDVFPVKDETPLSSGSVIIIDKDPKASYS